MCDCANATCPECDTGFEAFYQQKVKEAKEAVAHFKTIGVEVFYGDLLGDAKDIWYEYCDLQKGQSIDDVIESESSAELQNLVNKPQNEW